MLKNLRSIISSVVLLGVIVASGATSFAASDTLPPTAPQNLSAYNVTVGDRHGARLTWTASSDNVGVSKYVITRTDMDNNGQRTFFTVAGNQTRYDDLMFQVGTGAIVSMYYSVKAYDSAGNASNASNDFFYTNYISPFDPGMSDTTN